jgi:thiol-disulfide isomerase/thioredoxin
LAAGAWPGFAAAQPARPAQPPAITQAPQGGPSDSIKSINDDYEEKLAQLERQRLERLAGLAGRQNAAEAASSYEYLFRMAIAANLFRDAEPAANIVVKNGSPSANTLALAYLVQVIARADRGAFEESLDGLRAALARREKSGATAPLTAGELVGICEAYYERLIHAGQNEVARKALRILAEHAEQPVLKDFLASRLDRLDRVGKPVAPLQGTDIDGKPFDLAALRGKVVLVVFWASWCLPSSAEVAWLQQAYDANRSHGFEIVGINVDALQDGGQKPETILPNVRRFLLDHNIRWPNLVSSTGDRDYAKAFGISEIPANFLIGRDGKVIQVDLVRKNADTVIARALTP